MIRFANEKDLVRVNELRKEVNDLHVEGRPDIFKEGFSAELRDYIYKIWEEENKEIIVAERNGVICGYACILFHVKQETPYTHVRKFCNVEEVGVDASFRRQGVATEIFEFISAEAKKRGFDRIELDMWEFNEEALRFYERIGFKTYRRYMEYNV